MSGAAPGRTGGAARSLLAQLAGKGPIEARILIVVAHPDDETIGLGAQFCRLRHALLLHVTDGAPRDGEDMRRLGFATPADYAAARRRELQGALAAGGAAGLRCASLGIADKEAYLDLAGLTSRIADQLRQEHPAVVLTHAYEGGHPDHDAAAFGVHAGCRLAVPGKRPEIVEMPFYHLRNGRMAAGRFVPGGPRPTVVRLDAAARRRKAGMVACFGTQREVLQGFPLDAERFRRAPAYDFRVPPHPGPLVYESWGWGISGSDWLASAARAMAVLDLE